MNSPVYQELMPVRTRQRWALALQTAVHGLLAGSVILLWLELGRWLLGWPISSWALASVPVGASLLGLLVGYVAGRSWKSAAAAVDAQYRFKDRITTALAFVTLPATTVLHELQVQDAVAHLKTVEPRRVVPLRLPVTFPFALGSLALAAILAVVMLFWPGNQPDADAGPAEPLAVVLKEAQRIEENLKEFEELAKEDQNKDLENLVQELRQKAEELKQPGVDEKEALALISEMQAAITAHMALYNVGLVDGQLQALGTALSSSSAALDGAGKALAEAQYEKAAQELEKIEDPQFERKESKALEERLKQVAKAMGDVGLGQMSDAASEMAEGAKGNGAKFQKASKQMAQLVRGHNRRKQINNFLMAELDQLNEGKCNCKGGNRNFGLRPEKSLSPSSSWGTSTSGNVEGQKTSLLSQRQLESITGNPGEGPSDVETTHSAEGRQQAARGYREVYKKYQRLSEAVLESEPIPLGHRQTIRRYFQLIRPQEGDKEKADPASGSQ